MTKPKEPQVIEGEVVKTAKPAKPKKPKAAKTGTAVAAAARSAPALKPVEEPTLMVAIARAAADPRVDVQKMVALHNLHREIQADEARRAFDSAFSKMQTELPIITKRGRIEIFHKDDKDKAGPPIQSTPFGKWDDIGRVIKPILAAHGFALWFKNGREADQVITTAILTHEGGHREETTVRVPIDVSGSKNNAQGVGSSTSYGKRYAGGSLLNIIFEDEDDDANGTAPTPAERQAARKEKTDQRLGRLAEKTAKKDEPEHDADGVISEDPKPAGGAKKEKEGDAAKGGGKPASEGEANANAPKSPDPRPDDAPFETFRAYIVGGLKKCENPKHLENFWKRDVLGWGPPHLSFIPPDYEDLQKLFADRKAELAGVGKK